jgi:hypothetical protein
MVDVVFRPQICKLCNDFPSRIGLMVRYRLPQSLFCCFAALGLVLVAVAVLRSASRSSCKTPVPTEAWAPTKTCA